MDINAQKEQFSIAYVWAVASVAGYSVNLPMVDDDSIDIGISARGVEGVIRSPRLELQVKCTSQEIERADILHFPLGLKNYNDLRGSDFLVPRILIVVIVPDKVGDWMVQSQEELAMRRCGYWLSLRESPETDNQSSVTVNIPKSQMFTVNTLKSIMNRIASGGNP